MLLGLAGLAIPLVIHLLHRRRYQVVDWGAMQFLQVSETTRRRLRLEEILLLAARMALVACLVLALAAPYGSGPIFAVLGGRPARDIVVVFDGSLRMGLDDGENPTPLARAWEWAADHIDNLMPGDRVAVVQAGEQMTRLLGEPTHDLDLARAKLSELGPPHGGCDWPRALDTALAILSSNPGLDQEVIILSDGSRQGWADDTVLPQWEQLARKWRLAGKSDSSSRIRMVEFRADPARTYPNYSLAPLQASRGVAWTGHEVLFRTAIKVEGLKEFRPPHRLRLQVDGQEVRDLPVPSRDRFVGGQASVLFRQRFDRPGTHRVSLMLEADLPTQNRPEHYEVVDCLPGDNHREVTVEVVDSLPVLLVDGAEKLDSASSTFFLARALGLASDGENKGAVSARVVTSQDFDPSALTSQGKSNPRVLVLADVPVLNPAQQDGIVRFLKGGGGVLVVLGERMEAGAPSYNEFLFQKGQGWLPARLDGVRGSLVKVGQAPAPDISRMYQPCLEMFNREKNALGLARFPRWWKATPGPGASVPAYLTSGDPWIVEKARPAERVLLCTTPLDRSWGSNFPALWEYPVLVHELVYYLAETPKVRVRNEAGRPGTSDLTPLSDEDRRKVAALTGVEYTQGTVSAAEVEASERPPHELWPWFLFGALLLVCVEVWLAGRMAR
jgi:hypothetical protein